MEKTITISIKEVENNLLNVINKAQLPASVLELILSNILNEVKTISQRQYEADIFKVYNSQQAEVDVVKDENLNHLNNGEENERGKISEEIKEDTTKE